MIGQFWLCSHNYDIIFPDGRPHGNAESRREELNWSFAEVGREREASDRRFMLAVR